MIQIVFLRAGSNARCQDDQYPVVRAPPQPTTNPIRSPTYSNHTSFQSITLLQAAAVCECAISTPHLTLQTGLSEGADGNLVALLSGGPLGRVVREGLLGHGLGLGGLLEGRSDGAGCPGDELLAMEIEKGGEEREGCM